MSKENVDAGDRVVSRQTGVAQATAPEADLEMTNVLMLRNGRIVYQEFFWEYAGALETLGLSE